MQQSSFSMSFHNGENILQFHTQIYLEGCLCAYAETNYTFQHRCYEFKILCTTSI